MKYKRIILIILFLIVLTIFLLINRSSYKVKYNKEVFIINEQKENQGLYIEIKHDNDIYPIRIFNYKKRKNIEKIYYYEDDKYKCILPIFKTENNIDVICKYNNILYNYTNLKGESKDLDDYVSSIKEYNNNRYVDDVSKYERVDDNKYFVNNEIYLKTYITSYNGLSTYKKDIILFSNDVYNAKISLFLNDYYLIADYSNNYEFNIFYAVNLNSLKIEKIKSKTNISYDSYIQGIIENKIYIYDIDNENQFEIDLEDLSINIVSFNDKINYYDKGNWTTISKTKANKIVYFDLYEPINIFDKYDSVKETNEYYYLFEFISDDKYKLYRVDKNNTNIIKYLFEIPTTNINAYNNYIYYAYGNKIYYYSDSTGLKTILENDELLFNTSIKYYIY